MSLADLRKDYTLAGLLEKDLAKDPFRQFERWFQEAEAAKIPEPNAMVLASSTATGRPSSRIVLLKGLDGRGFTFFTNYDSRKSHELIANPYASLTFPWITMERQVLIEGQVVKISHEENDAYFHSRPQGSQIGAWASPQSTVIASRSVLEDALKSYEKKYAGQTIPLPANWGGFRVIPESVEFWQGRRNRLHDRLRYRRDADGAWMVERLAP